MRRNDAAHASRQPEWTPARAQNPMRNRCQMQVSRQPTSTMDKIDHLEYFEHRVSLRGRSARSTRYSTSLIGVGAIHA
jgi:hypothetical protein